jgi:hypothetical protein
LEQSRYALAVLVEGGKKILARGFGSMSLGLPQIQVVLELVQQGGSVGQVDLSLWRSHQLSEYFGYDQHLIHREDRELMAFSVLADAWEP